MNENVLCAALRKKIAGIVELLQLPASSGDGSLKAPQVVDGFLPPKRSDNVPDYPFVIVRPSAGEDEPNGSQMTYVDIKILIGCYSEEFDVEGHKGHQLPLLVMSEIRRGLKENATIDGIFRKEPGFKWKLYDDQPYPEWVLECMVRYSIPSVTQTPDEGVL